MNATLTTSLGGGDVYVHLGDHARKNLPVNPDGQLLGLDVETTWMDDREQFGPAFRVRTVQFATETHGFVLDVADPKQRLSIVSVLNDDRNSFVSHTPMDVAAVWREFGIDLSARNIDTHQLASMADTDKDRDRDLKTLATENGMPELEAAERELHAWMLSVWPGRKNAKKADIHEHGWNLLASMPPEEWPEMFARYAALDAIACRRLAPILTAKTQNPPELLAVDHWLAVRSVRRKLTGLRVDPERLALHLDEAKTAHDAAKAEAEDVAGVNVNGPKVHDWLAEHGVVWDDWPGDRSDNTGNPSLAKDNILLLREFDLDEPGRLVVERMIEQRKHMDMLRKTESVAARITEEEPGIHRIHPTLNPLGASTTGRMSSSGPNVQNFSKKDPRARGMFLPEPGYVLATIDFAQIELRVVAALAREEKMIETIVGGGDLHDLTVAQLAELGVEITRDTGKMGNFLIVYGGGPKALSSQASIPIDVAAQVVYGMREQYPSITALTKYLGMERKAIRTIAHRRLAVTRNRKTGDLRTYANINYAVQSAARELLVTAWRRLEIDHNRPGIVWWPIHDELVLHIPEDQVADVIAEAEASMRFDFRGVPITADAVVLRDAEGTSRWMTSKLAEQIAAAS